MAELSNQTQSTQQARSPQTQADAAAVDAMLQQRLAAMLGGQAQAAPQQPVAQAMQPAVMQAVPGMMAAPTPRAIMLRIRMPTPRGEAGGYLLFDLPANATAESVQGIVLQACQTWPIETYQPRGDRDGWQGRSGGNGYRGGYSRGGGGYGGRRW